MGWFPIVGALLGVLLVALDTAASTLLHPSVVNALLVAGFAALSGALHLDGLIDTADGLAADLDPAAQLAAMRQAHAGPTGAIAGCVALVAMFAALGGLPPSARAPGLFLAPVAGRAAILLGYYLFPYARPGPGVSRSLKDGATARRAGLGVAAAAGLAGGVAALAGLLVLALALLGTWLLGWWMARRLGGLTGDVQGALCETAQLIVLLAGPLLHVR